MIVDASYLINGILKKIEQGLKKTFGIRLSGKVKRKSPTVFQMCIWFVFT